MSEPPDPADYGQSWTDGFITKRPPAEPVYDPALRGYVRAALAAHGLALRGESPS